MAVTVASLVADVRIMSGLRQNQLFTDDQIVGLLNDANQELTELIMKANEHHLMVPFDFTLLGGIGDGNDSVDLPSDFVQGHSVDGDRDLSSQYTVSYLSNWLQRNLSKFAYRPRYFFRAGKLVMYPSNRAAGNYRLWYTPTASLLALPRTRTFTAGTSDQPLTAGPLSAPAWACANGAFSAQDVGGILTPTMASPNTAWNVACTITVVLGASTVNVTPSPVLIGYTLPSVGSFSLYYQPLDTVPELPDVLAPYAQYLKLHASITIRQGREKDESDLVQKLERYTIRVQSSVTNRAEEPSQPPLTRDGTGLDGDGNSTIEWARE